ncbi:MAG: hypothetical protein ACOY5B_18705 [Spirochaetota bacterium]
MMTDLKNNKILPSLLASLLLATACNMEVGNPDTGDAPASLLHSVQLKLTPYDTCSQSKAPCNSVPVSTGSASVYLRYELTSATFAVAGVTPRPAPEQLMGVSADLFSDPTLALPSPLIAANITDLELHFVAPAAGNESWQIDGSLVGTINGARVALRLPLAGSGEITGSVAMPETGLEAIWFDAAAWFDWSGDPALSQVSKILESGACRATDSLQCGQLSAVLSKLVEKRISSSLRATGQPKEIKKTQK